MIPHFDDNFGQIGERAAQDKAIGKTCYVPADVNYAEWKRPFVDADKSGLQEAVFSDTIIVLRYKK